MVSIRFSGKLPLLALILSAATLSACSSGDAKDPVARGQEAVVARDCGSCHTPKADPAKTLSGSDVPYEKTNAYPQNLTPDDETGIASWSDDLIVRAILSGIDDEDEELCPTMPRFQETGMTESEARDIAAYLRTLTPVKHSIPESTCPPIKGGDGPADGGS
ncbi:MAG TPA: cytochrome c [Polyangiaceae bacterium]|nr:cytochrome c [Polyangiaceae bacterium]